MANAGPNQTVNQGATVKFNGTGSTDNVGIVNYTWSIPVTATSPTYRFGTTFGSQYVFDPVRPYVYEMNTTQIAFVNLTSGAIEQTFRFAHVAAWPLSLAVSPKGKYLVVGIPTGDRGYYDFGPYSGYLAGFDLVNRTEIGEFAVAYDIYDVAATDNGYAILSGGSGQWTPLEAINLSTHAVASGTQTIWQGSPIVMHPSDNRVYSVDGNGINPQAVRRYDYNATGGLQTDIAWPYWGPFPGYNLWVGPDRIVTSNGLLLVAQANATGDMSEITPLAAPSVQLAALDPAFGLIAVDNGTGLQFYDSLRGTLLTGIPVDTGIEALQFRAHSIDLILGGWYASMPIPETFLYGPTPSRVFPDAGVFVVRLTVWDAAGNFGTATVSITVRDTTPPHADAGANRTVIHGTQIILDASRSWDNVGIVAYWWTFNDGGPQNLTGETVTYTFQTIGGYPVTLHVVDAAGNQNATTVTVTVIRDAISPTAVAGPDATIFPGMTYVFDGNGSTDNVGIASYTWTFDDGGPQTLTGVRPAYRFASPGDYAVTLTVRDLDGNNGTGTMTVHVIPVPLQVYAHPTTFFRMGLPSGWTPQPDVRIGQAGADVLASGTLLQSSAATLFVVSGSQAVTESDTYLMSEASRAIEALQSRDSTVAVIEPARIVSTADGRAATFGITLSGGAMYEVWAIVVNAAYAREWVIVGTAQMADHDTYQSVFAAVIGSFYVTPPPWVLQYPIPFAVILTAAGAVSAVAAAWAIERLRRRPAEAPHP